MLTIKTNKYEINVLNYKDFDTITFSNGFDEDRDQFVIELKNIKIDYGKKEWGAIPETQYFVLELGEILSSNMSKNTL